MNLFLYQLYLLGNDTQLRASFSRLGGGRASLFRGFIIPQTDAIFEPEKDGFWIHYTVQMQHF